MRQEGARRPELKPNRDAPSLRKLVGVADERANREVRIVEGEENVEGVVAERRRDISEIGAGAGEGNTQTVYGERISAQRRAGLSRDWTP